MARLAVAGALFAVVAARPWWPGPAAHAAEVTGPVVGVAIGPGEALVARGDGFVIEPAPAALAHGARVDLNRASSEVLATLPGVGAQRAEAIVAARPYRSVAELERARGFGPHAVAAVADWVTVHADVPAPPKVDLNCATVAQLDRLPRIGPALAARIVAGRPYADVDALQRVRGIGPAAVAALAEHATAGTCR